MHEKERTFLRRSLAVETKVLDEKKGLVEYVASDETLDSYREVIRSSGWRFTHFKKNAPFVDSHDYSSIDKLLGGVVDFSVRGGRLIEVVQWAKDVGANVLAQIGWGMTQAGFLKAVSVGFWPVQSVSKFASGADKGRYLEQATDLGFKSEEDGPDRIFTQQEQVELSAVVLGANPNALARAYKAGLFDETQLDQFSQEYVRRNTSAQATQDAQATARREHRRQAFLRSIQTITKSI